MADNDINISMVVNAPVEQVWPLLVEHQQADSKAIGQKYFSDLSPKPVVAGQVIHKRLGFLHLRIYIDRIVPADPPAEGQTTLIRIVFLGREGKLTSSWVHDTERYHIQEQFEFDHPWLKNTDQITIRCLGIDTSSCVIIYTCQSMTNIRLVPRWLARLLDNNDHIEKDTLTRTIETSLRDIKTKAEQSFHQPPTYPLQT
ncbi:hypothetical protein KDH_71990 [Dictyobacter sp. S3.2.2.5]|uniref:SRPBCC family protein n=1 Tax=Dictyobacter halimunensis TaxID=3026934 RepID=A0ABQ6G495_9CHLR|nr:hypothetical protein KDH_71990 [Dictyobacter sp. S3.2.2.5]